MIELTQLDLFEVSLVDAGDDPLAKVALYKRKKGSDMDEDKTQEVDTLKAEVDTLTQEVDTLKAKIAELEAEVVEKAKTEDEMIDFGGELVAKSAIPAPVLKQLEELQKAKEVEELRKLADEKLPNFKGTSDQRGKLLKSIGDDADLLAMLMAADALFAELFKEEGEKDFQKGMKDAADELDELVKGISVEKKLTYEQAYAEVAQTTEGRKLINKTYKKE